MKPRDGKTQPSWGDKLAAPAFSPLRESTRTEVCVVGADIAGLTTAYLLLRGGHRVIVLDQERIGGGQTGRTSAHLASAIDDRFLEIERLHGVKASRLAYQSHAAAIDMIESIADREKIDCDFARVDGLLSLAPGDDPKLLDREFAAARRAGVRDLQLRKTGGLANARCIRFANQARFDPAHYVLGLADAVIRIGGRIFTGKRVIDAQGADRKRDKPGRVTLEDKRYVEADQIVVATNVPSPINDWFGIYTKQASYRTYVVALEIPDDAVADALYWDTGDPYHYVRLQSAARDRATLLIVGGEDHKTGQRPTDASPFKSLERWTREMFPAAGKVRYRWSGQVQEPADGLAFIGRALTSKDDVFVITGDSGMGLTHGTLGAMLITDLIEGRKNPWAAIYDPSRKMTNREFIKENANTLKQYRELLTAGEVKTVAEIPRGGGAVMRKGLSKIAIHRDSAGKLHKCSAVCTHLQCIVHWNPAEKSWDCPCHGSRFAPTGQVLLGPAVDDLPKA